MIFLQIANGLINNNEEQLWIILLFGINYLFMSISSIYQLSFRGTLKLAKLGIPSVIGTICGAIFSLISIFIFENFLLYLGSNTLLRLFSYLQMYDQLSLFPVDPIFFN